MDGQGYQQCCYFCTNSVLLRQNTSEWKWDHQTRCDKKKSWMAGRVWLKIINCSLPLLARKWGSVALNEQVTGLKQTDGDASYHVWLKLGNISPQNMFSGTDVHDVINCLNKFTVENPSQPIKFRGYLWLKRNNNAKISGCYKIFLHVFLVLYSSLNIWCWLLLKAYLVLDGSSNLKQILFVFLGDFNQILQELKAQMSLTRNEFHKSQQKHLLCRNYRSKKKQEEGKKKKKKKSGTW